mmetsp:Transcript_31473/g.84499  ORF Transcript_31473/g.84499 Transcript_31473/m.84499 type:complete len:311 (-) Transcript_31473:103-1035(-)
MLALVAIPEKCIERFARYRLQSAIHHRVVGVLGLQVASPEEDALLHAVRPRGHDVDAKPVGHNNGVRVHLDGPAMRAPTAPGLDSIPCIQEDLRVRRGVVLRPADVVRLAVHGLHVPAPRRPAQGHVTYDREDVEVVAVEDASTPLDLLLHKAWFVAVGPRELPAVKRREARQLRRPAARAQLQTLVFVTRGAGVLARCCPVGRLVARLARILAAPRTLTAGPFALHASVTGHLPRVGGGHFDKRWLDDFAGCSGWVCNSVRQVLMGDLDISRLPAFFSCNLEPPSVDGIPFGEIALPHHAERFGRVVRF